MHGLLFVVNIQTFAVSPTISELSLFLHCGHSGVAFRPSPLPWQPNGGFGQPTNGLLKIEGHVLLNFEAASISSF